MIAALSLSHRESPLDVRERLQGAARDMPPLLGALRREARGVAVLATCYRFEVYASGVGGDALRSALVSSLGLHGRDAALFRPFEGIDAAAHLFRVACGLESPVLGEVEILGQVRRAYSEAVDSGAADPVLSHLFHEALRVGRRAREETVISRGSLSLAALAVESARRTLGSLRGRSALVVGTGEAGTLLTRVLAGRGASPVAIASHLPARAEGAAAGFGGRALDLADVTFSLPEWDIVATAHGGDSPVLRLADVRCSQRVRCGRPVVFLDLGFPRDVEPDVRSLPGVTLVDLDDLEALAARNAGCRAAAVVEVEDLIERAVREFEAWLRTRRVVPTIAALTEWAEQVRRRQLGRAFRGHGLDAAERAALEPVLDGFSRALVQKLLHPLIAAMREPESGPANARLLEDLMGLTGRGREAVR